MSELKELKDLKLTAMDAIRAWLGCSLFELKEIMESLRDRQLVTPAQMTLRQAYMIEILTAMLPSYKFYASRLEQHKNEDYITAALALADAAIKAEEK